MDDLISRKAAIDQAMGKLDYTDVIFDTATESEIVYMLRSLPSIPAVPLDKLCNTLSGLYEVLPCWECEKVLGEEYCQERECACGSIGHWKSYFEKKMEGLDAAD